MPSRRHIVFVPGFVGFDALGQLEYYAGVTSLFERWGRDHERDISLHYFDNFPTASVAHRAQRLTDYLMKRIAYSEFAEEDCVTLVGHSTGGLDIRRVIYDLGKNAQDSRNIERVQVEHKTLLARVDSIVFLSTPHYGTNLADFTFRLIESIQRILRDATSALWFNREPFATVRKIVSRHVLDNKSDLLRAIDDALNESDESPSSEGANLASEREARAKLGLWLEHMSKDFSIIADLRSASSEPKDSDSPAHFNAVRRAEELKIFRDHNITTRSYATIVPARKGLAPTIPAFISEIVGEAASGIDGFAKLVNDVANSWSLAPIALVVRATSLVTAALGAAVPIAALRSHPDIVFRLFYALCADPAGPFRVEASQLTPSLEDFAKKKIIPSETIKNGDSDGVVNTRSMLWPYDESEPDRHAHFLVEADHADIIGHYKLHEEEGSSHPGRKYDAYDIFPSGSNFADDKFKAIWTDIFSHM